MTGPLMLATGNGVFLAEDNGVGYEPRPRGLEGRGIVRWIVADPSDPGRAWAATERAGVWRTDDGGQSWAEKNEGLVYKHCLSLALHPATGALYVGTEPACIFRSTDGGESWVELETLRRLGTRKDWTFPGPPYVAHVGASGCPRPIRSGGTGDGEEGVGQAVRVRHREPEERLAELASIRADLWKRWTCGLTVHKTASALAMTDLS